ncbi:hypothetical protein BDZ91DRAFT_803034 [Kalaharituber pfeilii]|nr:hypothetical protein BDZ91DRAFT_803034 [Kalaharituber pfeilii]
MPQNKTQGEFNPTAPMISAAFNQPAAPSQPAAPAQLAAAAQPAASVQPAAPPQPAAPAQRASQRRKRGRPRKQGSDYERNQIKRWGRRKALEKTGRLEELAEYDRQFGQRQSRRNRRTANATTEDLTTVTIESGMLDNSPTTHISYEESPTSMDNSPMDEDAQAEEDYSASVSPQDITANQNNFATTVEEIFPDTEVDLYSELFVPNIDYMEPVEILPSSYLDSSVSSGLFDEFLEHMDMELRQSVSPQDITANQNNFATTVEEIFPGTAGDLYSQLFTQNINHMGPVEILPSSYLDSSVFSSPFDEFLAYMIMELRQSGTAA